MSETQQLPPIADRAKQFQGDLVSLLEKHKVGIAALPVIVGDGRLSAKVTVFDDSEEARSANAEKAKEAQAAPAEGGITTA